MNVVHIFLDVDQDQPLKRIPRDKIIEGGEITFCRLRHGMLSGASSVSISASLPDGRQVVLQCSMSNFEMVAAAFAGAEARDKEQKNQ